MVKSQNYEEEKTVLVGETLERKCGPNPLCNS